MQERALAVALLRAEADEVAEPRTTVTALVGILAALAAGRPVLLAIDDVQWLDAASEDALALAEPHLRPAPGWSGVRASAEILEYAAKPDTVQTPLPCPRGGDHERPT